MAAGQWFSSPYAQAVLNDRPVAYWRFSETTGTNATDSSGRGQTGTYTGSPTLGATSLLTTDKDKSVTFSGGTDQYVRVTDSAVLDLGDVFTTEFWIKGTFGTDQIFLDKGVNSWQIKVHYAGGTVNLDKNGVAGVVASTIAVDDGLPHHIVIAKNGAISTKLYIDATDRTGVVTDATLANTSTDLFVGISSALASRMTGTFDELALYDYALTSAQVTTHHNAA